DEVPRRPLGHDRWLCRHERPDDRRAALLPAEVARRRAWTIRFLARPAWHQDARGTHAPALRQRDGGRRVAGAARQCRTRPLPGAAVAPATPACREADERLRRAGSLPPGVGDW